ncbi:hypothetical protein ACGFY6_33335 [Streptomyces sp. NPDC048387]|uniref:hypothetical protein n=1 Tax=Streptomyces sp. NPDC048387 TaxID=3365542 RepID=UPI003718F943
MGAGSPYDTEGCSSGYSPQRAANGAPSRTTLLAGGAGAALALAGGAALGIRRHAPAA